MTTLTKPATLRATAGFNPLDPIGSILNNALGDVEKAIDKVADKVHDATADIIRQAGDQAFRIISSLKGAYEESLEKTYEAADKLLQQNIDRVDDLVKAITESTAESLATVADKVGDIIKFSPLSNWWIPLLDSVSPRFSAVGVNPTDLKNPTITKIEVVFKGNFAYADQYAPVFTLSGKDYTPVSNTTKELRYFVDVSSDDPKISMHCYSYLSGALKVTWKSGYISGWVKSEYKALLGILPATPGKIQVVYVKPMHNITRNYASPAVQIIRDVDHWVDGNFSAAADPGWHVVQGTQRVVWLNGPHGQCGAEIAASANPDVVNCRYFRKNGSGQLQIAFTESQPDPEHVRTEDHDDLRWGSSFIATPQDAERIRQINFQSINGDTVQFQPRTDETNPFITLRLFNDTIQVVARRADEINKDTLSFKAVRKIESNEGKRE